MHFGYEGIDTLTNDHPKSKHLMNYIVKDRRTIYQYPAEAEEMLKKDEKAKARAPLSYTELEPRLMQKNDELMQLGYEQMGKEEFLSARMYTGPVSAAPLPVVSERPPRRAARAV